MYSVIIICLHSIIQNQVTNPGGGLDKATDRDQRSWVLLNNPKNTLPPTENPKKYFPKNKTLKNTVKNTIHFAKVKHDMIIMETHDY